MIGNKHIKAIRLEVANFQEVMFTNLHAKSNTDADYLHESSCPGVPGILISSYTLISSVTSFRYPNPKGG